MPDNIFPKYWYENYFGIKQNYWNRINLKDQNIYLIKKVRNCLSN